MDARKILKRFTKPQLQNEVWQVLNVFGVTKPGNTSTTKEQIISYILKTAKNASCDMKKLTLSLEMKCSQIQQRQRQWSALEIKNQEHFVERTTLPENFAKKLNKILNKSQLFCDVVSEFFNNVLWTAISIQHKQSRYTFFLLAYVKLPIVLHSHVKASHYDILKRSLVRLFSGTNCEALSMVSKNINTLMVFAHQRSNLTDVMQEGNSIFQRPRKRGKDLLQLPSNITNEDDDDERERKCYLETTFGLHEQPAIESLTYNISSEFYGFDQDDKPLNVISRVVLKGENVLEGIQQLVENGVADIPLPDYVTDVFKYGTNRFNLNIKAAIEDTGSVQSQIS